MILNEIAKRQSVRQYSGKKIPENDIKEILEAGRIAPSWMNVQPWHFIVVDDEETKTLLSISAKYQKQIKEASHVIVLLGDFAAWNNKNFGKILTEKGMPEDSVKHILSDKGYNPAQNTSAILIARTMEQCSYAMAFMVLQAQSLGVDCCIIGAFANELTGFNPDVYETVKEKLNIPDSAMIAGMLTLGYRSENVKDLPKRRKSFNSVVSYGKYGQRLD